MKMNVAAFIGFLLSEDDFGDVEFASESLEIHPIDDVTEVALHADTKRDPLDCTKETGTCGGTYYSQDVGCIVSPDYGVGGYENGIDCVYEIKVSEDRRIELTIQDLDIEFHSSCNWDRMEIIPGRGVFGALKVCGSKPPQGAFVSMADTMTVRLTSDASKNGNGFAAKFASICIDE